MRKLVCIECGELWYTSSTFDGQICPSCGAALEEVSEKPENVYTHID